MTTVSPGALEAEPLVAPAPAAASQSIAEAPRAVAAKPAVRHKDKHSRSLLKAISWRVTGTIDTMVISYLITGKVKLAVSIGFVEVFTKIALFYFHERLWTRIPYGRAKGPEDYSI